MSFLNGAMSRVWTRMNESCHTYDWVMSHIWTSHVTHMKACLCTLSRRRVCMRLDCVFCLPACMSHATHTYTWVTSHIWCAFGLRAWMSHVTHNSGVFQFYIWNPRNLKTSRKRQSPDLSRLLVSFPEKSHTFQAFLIYLQGGEDS